MKQVMKKAHKMTKEIKKEYPEVDYRTQLGLCLSYLIKEEKEMEFLKKEEVKDFKEGMLTLTTSNRQPAWVAEITGADARYVFKREFLEVAVNGGRWVDYKLNDGKIYNWGEGKRQYFGIVENGKLFEVSKADVEKLLG